MMRPDLKKRLDELIRSFGSEGLGTLTSSPFHAKDHFHMKTEHGEELPKKGSDYYKRLESKTTHAVFAASKPDELLEWIVNNNEKFRDGILNDPLTGKAFTKYEINVREAPRGLFNYQEQAVNSRMNKIVIEGGSGDLKEFPHTAREVTILTQPNNASLALHSMYASK